MKDEEDDEDVEGGPSDLAPDSESEHSPDHLLRRLRQEHSIIVSPPGQ